jgi:hypothetical protein
VWVRDPIASKSERQFEDTAKRQLAGLSERHKAMIKDTQPFHRGVDAATHPLAMLADLSNTDKHQVVHTAFNIVSDDAAATLDALVAGAKHEQSPVTGWWLANEGKLEQGTPWLRIVWRRAEPPPKEVKIVGNITTQVAFGKIGMPASSSRSSRKPCARSLKHSWLSFRNSETTATRSSASSRGW